MAVAPEQYRAARLAVPRLPLPAIIGFAVAAVGGSVFLAYTSFNHGGLKFSAAATNDVPVYSARAVPFDSPREDPAQRAALIARALTATQMQVHRGETIEMGKAMPAPGPTLFAGADRPLRGFSRFTNFAGTNTFLTFARTSFGISSESLPSGFAPDAEMLPASPVPEASTWMCGASLLVLVAVRGIHARWHRKRRRTDQ